VLVIPRDKVLNTLGSKLRLFVSSDLLLTLLLSLPFQHLSPFHFLAMEASYNISV